jgi:tetratricopeptide (TPR) repeat protein
VRQNLLQTAYALNDAALIQKQMEWAAEHPDAVDIREEEAEAALAAGRFSEALRKLAQLDALFRHQGMAGTADYEEIAEGDNLMEVGDFEQGKRLFRSAPFD